MNDAQVPEASGITGLILIGVALIPWLTWAISECLLALYRRAVVRAMSRQGPVSGGPTPAPTSPAIEPATTGRPLVMQPADHEAVAALSGHVLYQRFRRATRTTASVYGAAGLVYAALMAIALGVQSATLSLGAWLAYTVAFAWPVVLTVLLLDPPRRRRHSAAIVVGYVVLFLVGGAAPGTGWFLFAIFFANVVATFVGLVVRARRIHAVAPLIGAVLTVVGAALLFAVAVTVFLGDSPATPGASSAMDFGTSLLLFGSLLALLAAGPLAAWFTLRLVAVWYGRKRTSDQGIEISALWLIFAGIQSTTFGFADARWIIAGLVVFVAFSAAAAVGFRLLRRRATRVVQAPRLLVLRVFALGRRSRRLFDRFTARWRHVGSVQLIAGPDLASSTVEPHEFLDFLRRRLGDRFLDSDDSIDRALGQLDTYPDPDGRYRTTDFFCRDHAWRLVFGRLAAESDVVLMDLRGFSPVNAGCTYEVSELLNIVPLQRIAIIVDGSTDEAFLARTLDEARRRLPASSPNFMAPEAAVRVFRETEQRGLDPDSLFRLLCDTAMPAGEARVPVAHAI